MGKREREREREEEEQKKGNFLSQIETLNLREAKKNAKVSLSLVSLSPKPLSLSPHFLKASFFLSFFRCLDDDDDDDDAPPVRLFLLEARRRKKHGGKKKRRRKKALYCLK